jgi:pyruvate decarboxylase
MGLDAAVEATVAFLDKAVKPVMVAGPKIRVAKAGDAFVELAEASGYAVAAMPSAKGLVPETLPRFLGTYWGAVSTAFCAEIVESADAYLFAGPIFNDYSSVGYSFLLKKDKAVVVQPDRVTVGNGPTLGCVMMKDFLSALAKRVRANTTAYDNYRRIFVPDGQPPECEPGEPLRVNVTSRGCSPATAPSSRRRGTRGSTARSSGCQTDAGTYVRRLPIMHPIHIHI